MDILNLKFFLLIHFNFPHLRQAEAEKAKDKMNLDEYFSENDQDMQSPQNEPFQLEMHLADGIFQSLFIFLNCSCNNELIFE